jgi:DNA-binding NtrC family response regulator
VEDLPESFTRDSFSADLQTLALLPDLERRAILAALDETGGHQQRAADKLGISRRTLQRKIRIYERVPVAG